RAYITTVGADGCRVGGGRGMAQPAVTVGSDGDVHLVVEIINSETDDVRQENSIGSIGVGGFFRRIPRPGNSRAVISAPRSCINLGCHAPEAKVAYTHPNRVNRIRLIPKPVAHFNQIWAG